MTWCSCVWHMNIHAHCIQTSNHVRCVCHLTFRPTFSNVSSIVLPLYANENCKLFCWLIYFRPTIAAVVRFRCSKFRNHFASKAFYRQRFVPVSLPSHSLWFRVGIFSTGFSARKWIEREWGKVNALTHIHKYQADDLFKCHFIQVTACIFHKTQSQRS